MDINDRQLIVLIGAARSGTKLVRDVLGAQPGLATVPYDVNFLWRIGNDHVPHDELTPAHVTPSVEMRVRRSLDRWWTSPILIEKTVGNCLRVPFVYRIFPNAKFIHLLRDGFDVVESSYRQWMARPDWRYLFRKLRSVPRASAPGYIARTGSAAIRRGFRRDDTRLPPVWGPAYQGIQEDLERLGVLETCAWQWRKCVESATHGLASVPTHQVHELRYEDFVRSPREHIARLTSFAGAPTTEILLPGDAIRTDDIGKGRRCNADTLTRVDAIVGPVRAKLGYTD